MDDASENRAVLTRIAVALERIAGVMELSMAPEPSAQPEAVPDGCPHPREQCVDLTGTGTFEEFECKVCRKQFRLAEQGA